MKGGFNKFLRNIVASSTDTEFEKVSDRCKDDTYGYRGWLRPLSIWTARSPRKSTLSVSSRSELTILLDLLECLNGDHPDEITSINAVKGLYTRHVSNTDNWAITMKTLISFHRALQNHRVLRKSGKEIHKRDQLMQPYKRSKEDFNSKMY